MKHEFSDEFSGMFQNNIVPNFYNTDLGVGKSGLQLFRHLAAQLLALLRVLPAKVVVFFRRLRKENELNNRLNALLSSIAKRRA
jgi:hypothetical protein